jgi:hypothetical protein
MTITNQGELPMTGKMVDRFEEMLRQDDIGNGGKVGEEIKGGVILVIAVAVLVGTGLLLILGAPNP